MRYMLILLLSVATVGAQSVYDRTKTVVSGGHRYDYDTNGKRGMEPTGTYGSLVLKQTFSYSDNSDADFYDLSTSGNDGAQGAATSRPTWSSADGGTYTFDGVNDFISLGAPSSLNFGTALFSISAWVNSTNTARSTVLSKFNYNAGVTEEGYYIDIHSTGKVRAGFHAGVTPSYRIRDSTLTVNDGSWHHVVAARVSTTDWKVYIDGSDDTGTSFASGAGTDCSTTKNAEIGRGDSNVSSSFDGEIDDVRVYDVTLTDAQVGAIYTNTAPTYGITP